MHFSEPMIVIILWKMKKDCLQSKSICFKVFLDQTIRNHISESRLIEAQYQNSLVIFQCFHNCNLALQIVKDICLRVYLPVAAGEAIMQNSVQGNILIMNFCME